MKNKQHLPHGHHAKRNICVYTTYPSHHNVMYDVKPSNVGTTMLIA
jgi:hypothetical protein